MSYDQCATIAEQVSWLKEIYSEHAGSFFEWARFAVLAGWKPK